MKVPTEKEVKSRHRCPEDTTLPPEVVTLPVLIPVTQDDVDHRTYQERLAEYHLKFFLLAKEKGYKVGITKYY